MGELRGWQVRDECERLQTGIYDVLSRPTDCDTRVSRTEFHDDNPRESCKHFLKRTANRATKF